jgi:hypothetical protein
LRVGTPSVTRLPLRASDYRIVVSRAGERTKARYWPVALRQPPAVIGIPLRVADPDVPLDLGAVLNAAADGGAYDLSVDYRRKPKSPLSADDEIWADRLLCERGIRLFFAKELAMATGSRFPAESLPGPFLPLPLWFMC